MDIQQIGRILFIVGCLLAVSGLTLMFAGRIMPSLGQLPGDFHVQWGNLSCFFPLATSIIISLVLTILLNLLARYFN